MNASQNPQQTALHTQIQNQQHYFEQTFSQLNGAQTTLRDVEFEACTFSECDFSAARWQNCRFINCHFMRCNLSLLELTGSRLFGMTFVDSKLIGIDWTKANWPIYHLDFELSFQRCLLSDASFFGLTLHELQMDECRLHDVDFREGDFRQSVMTHCDFTASQFMRTNLQDADLSDSHDFALDVLENQVTGAKFSRYEALALLECLGIELVD
ncbi:MAG: pentapeptide repeat-containing protein [Plesiomonas shigelloides]